MEIRKKELILGGIYTIANQSMFELSERDVERNANTKRGALYESFSSKKEFVDACFSYILAELLESNSRHLELNSKDVSIKEKGRNIWFNTIAWWLGNPNMHEFYVQYITSKYYFENTALNAENRLPYFLLGKEAVEAGFIKPLPIEFLHELIIAQMLNTLNFIKKYPKLSADTQFLDLSFGALWDSLSVNKSNI